MRQLEAGQGAEQVVPTEGGGVDALGDGDVEQLGDRTGTDLGGVAVADVADDVARQPRGGLGGLGLAGAGGVEGEDGVSGDSVVGVVDAVEGDREVVPTGDELLLEVVASHAGSGRCSWPARAGVRAEGGVRGALDQARAAVRCVGRRRGAGLSTAPGALGEGAGLGRGRRRRGRRAGGRARRPTGVAVALGVG